VLFEDGALVVVQSVGDVRAHGPVRIVPVRVVAL
jgi:hypothetical protein